MPLSLTIEEVLRRRATRSRWLNNDTYAAFALAGATVAALVWANIGGSYDTVWSTRAGISVAGLHLDLTLSEWVDEGVMTIFFFSVGLDVRRELTLGELRAFDRAVLPVAGAIGGLVLPALLFLLVTHGQPWSHAWGSVISTDTAFALGMLALVGPRNAPRLRVFLLTLAVVDDIGALSTIAVFYTENLNLIALAVAVLGLVGVWLLQRRGVWRTTPYLVVGLITWVATYVSGVHATLAGVLLALLMPVYPPRRQDVDSASVLFRLFRQAPVPSAAKIARDALTHAVPLNQRLSAALPPYVNFLVVPLFALANAGVALSGDALAAAFTSTLTWGVIIGLVGGKLVGITAASAVVMKVLPGSRLPGLDLPRVAGAAGLSGMGFTISLLVVGLALPDPAQGDLARVGVLTASLLALVVGAVLFRLGDRFKPLPEPEGVTLQRPVDPERDHIRGGPGTDTGGHGGTVVVYAALDDVYRRQTAEALAGVRRRLDGDVRIVFRHHTTDDASTSLALALEAAAAQNGFWSLHDAVVRSGRSLLGPDADEDALQRLAAGAGLDCDALAERMNSGTDQTRVDDDNLDAESASLPARPVLYVNGRRIPGPANSWQIRERLRLDEADRTDADS